MLAAERKRGSLVVAVSSVGTSKLREIVLMRHVLHHLEVRLLARPYLLLWFSNSFSRSEVFIGKSWRLLVLMLLVLRKRFLQVLCGRWRDSMVRIASLAFLSALLLLIFPCNFSFPINSVLLYYNSFDWKWVLIYFLRLCYCRGWQKHLEWFYYGIWTWIPFRLF